MSATSPHDARRRLLDPSELGTKEYWDAAYARELGNYEEDAEDEGTIWFAESNAEDAILDQLNGLEEAGLLRRSNEVDAEAESDGTTSDHSGASEPSRFLDLGTGNGHLLFALRDEDEEGRAWSGEMVGVDYSETSVQLARRIASEKQLEAGTVRFEQWNLLNDTPEPSWLLNGFDVALDKGTFDAISLMPYTESSRHPCEIYRDKTIPLIKPGGFLCITSCNWTKDELLDWLAPTNSLLKYYSEAKYPTFTFGGRTGQSIVTLVLQKAMP